MRFLNPLGFLALLGIPVLILIYIIKNRYTEQTVASTYLWTLSEKFLRRRVPINRLTGILSLILQILAVILVAVIVSQPIISVNGAAEAYCFIFDGSGSMSMTEGGSTRFDEGRERIKEIINGSVKGSTYTLIYAGGTTETIFEDYTVKERAIEAIDGLERAYKDTGLSDALTEAQKYFNQNPAAKTYLITDKVYAQSQNVEIINVNGEAENFAVSSAEYAFTTGGMDITGKAVSYTGAAEVTLELRVNGEEEPLKTQKLSLAAGEEQDFTIETDLSDFASFELKIAEQDDLALDNSLTIYNIRHENASRTLLVSDGAIFLRSALTAAGNTQVDRISTEEYSGQTGYGLYIFENFVPDSTPTDGSVWYVNPGESPEGANFSYQTEVEARLPAAYSTSTKTAVRKVLSGVQEREFLLKKYVKLGTGGGDFTVYATCDGSPLIFSGANAYGNREVVFAFGLQDSAAFTLSLDCVTLISNLLSYSFPEVVEQTSFMCGDMLQINILPGCKGVKVVSPSGKESYPDINTVVSECELTEVGAYKIYLTMGDGTERGLNVFSALPYAERQPVSEEESFVLSGQPAAGGLPGIYDDLLIIFIILAVVVAVDFGVYCYEQYQLR